MLAVAHGSSRFGEPRTKLDDIDHQLSTLLRRTAPKRGLKVRQDGFVALEAVLKKLACSHEEISNVVDSSHKRGEPRFELYGDGSRFWIRAKFKHQEDMLKIVDRDLVHMAPAECFRINPPEPPELPPVLEWEASAREKNLSSHSSETPPPPPPPPTQDLVPRLQKEIEELKREKAELIEQLKSSTPHSAIRTGVESESSPSCGAGRGLHRTTPDRMGKTPSIETKVEEEQPSGISGDQTPPLRGAESSPSCGAGRGLHRTIPGWMGKTPSIETKVEEEQPSGISGDQTPPLRGWVATDDYDNSEDSSCLKVQKGDHFDYDHVQEKTEHDGWSYVRTETAVGYVPTKYLAHDW